MSPLDEAGKARRWISIIGFVLAISAYLGRVGALLPDPWKSRVNWSALALAFVFLLPLLPLLITVLKRLHMFLNTVESWLVLAVVVLSMVILRLVLPPSPPLHLPFDAGKGALFNSTDSHPELKQHIWVWGESPGVLMWVIDSQRAAHFGYNSIPAQRDTNASSGGYFTFYGKPCDRKAFHQITFKCRALSPCAIPDVGIRLAVDNPSATGDRELVTYEVPSLSRYYEGKKRINGHWQSFTVDLGDFTQTRLLLPIPQGLDEDTINKIVFFVSDAIVRTCAQGELWFRDVTFER
jgi:hypothetical protein